MEQYTKPYYDSVSQPVEELSLLVMKHFGQSSMTWTGVDKLTEYAHGVDFVRLVFGLEEYLRNNKQLMRDINPSQYFKIAYKFQLASKSLSINVPQIVDCYFNLANYSIDVYNALYNDTINNIQNCNIIEIVSKAERESVGRFCGVLRSYAETVFCDEHTIAGEVISPLEYNNRTWIIRRYRNLDAVEVWPELDEFPYSTIDIYVRYERGTPDAHTDLVGNIDAGINYYAVIDGLCVKCRTHDGRIECCRTLEDITRITSVLIRTVQALLLKFRKMSVRERLQRKIECEYYAMKPYCDIIGKGWSPSSCIYDFMHITNPDRPIVKANNIIAKETDEEKRYRLLVELNDPRIHW